MSVNLKFSVQTQTNSIKLQKSNNINIPPITVNLTSAEKVNICLCTHRYEVIIEILVNISI